MTRIEDYEKLGAFYMGREFDSEKDRTTDDLLMYDAKDLTTHAVCVGMTGSGKTGLCVTLLEEALIDGIPALVVDLKGDLGNLMLTFPRLDPSEFLPWVDPAEAQRKGMTSEEYSKWISNLWKKGLGDWDQNAKRVKRLRAAADMAIYTPGSNAGLPLTILRSFSAPPTEVMEDSDAFRAQVSAAVSGLLALLGIKADPVRSREHILLSNILDRSWQKGRDLDIGSLIREIQSPPFERIGVFDLDVFYPAADRFELAMTLNNLLASPGFQSWMEGEPLDINRLLWTPEGKPRCSILSIAHLSDSERMFFMTVFLNEITSWIRTQPGSSSLRALLYIDEVFGYLPPTANPPSKTPLLTLLKQARAFGFGVVLATQNPVDLDYKALSNAGTWFLGRLQTERDKLRVIDGLEGASTAAGANFDRGRIEALLSGLKSRVFLMNNVHEDEPVLFHTRWALSYLRGPLTRKQIGILCKPLRKKVAAAEKAALDAAGGAVRPVKAKEVAAAPVKKSQSKKKGAAGTTPYGRPILPAGIIERFLPPLRGFDEGDLVYRPTLVASADLHYANARTHIDFWRKVSLLAPLTAQTVGDPWDDASVSEDFEEAFDRTPEDDIRFAELPRQATLKTSYTKWGRSLKSALYRDQAITIWRCPELKKYSEPGEAEGDFLVRMTAIIHEKRDLAVEKLRKRYGSKLATLKDRIRRAEERVQREESQYSQQKTQTAISFGASILGALFGRKLKSAATVGRAATAARGVGRAAREKGDIGRAQENLVAAEEKLAEMEEEFEDEIAEIHETYGDGDVEVEEYPVRPRKSDISVGDLTLLWTPWSVSARGIAEPAFKI